MDLMLAYFWRLHCCYFVVAGLMISGFSRASVVLGDSSCLERAKKAAQFVKQHLYNKESGTLVRNAYRDANGYGVTRNVCLWNLHLNLIIHFRIGPHRMASLYRAKLTKSCK